MFNDAISAGEVGYLYNSSEGNSYSNWTESCPNNFIIERTWTAEDECGNISAATQTISVEDNTAPELTVPADIDIACNDDRPYRNWICHSY